MRVRIVREHTGDDGTPGTLTVEGEGFTCRTLELPWRGNRRGVSCIPAGTYPARLSWSPKRRRRLYELAQVPGRDDVQIHAGNYAGDTAQGYRSDVEGCILLGREWAVAKVGALEQVMVAQSRATVKAFEDLMAGRPFTLSIEWAHGEPAALVA